MIDEARLETLSRGVAARDPASVARAVSIVEDRRPAASETTSALLKCLRRAVDPLRASRFGVTGPPGVGKSTLVSALVKATRQSGRTVGVLAVDPSSPRSGGALLGDRARIDIDPDDIGLFVRSMASGGDLGGLSRAAGAAVDVLSAAYDVVFVETTGVGQSETDVEHVTDTVLLVIQPGSGDVLQFLKAGIIEIPDVFAVNKSDLGAMAERAHAELAAALAVAQAPDVVPLVIRTSAATLEGVDELLGALDAHRRGLVERDALRTRRVHATSAWAYRLFLQEWGERGVERAGGPARVKSALETAVQRGATAVEAVAANPPLGD